MIRKLAVLASIFIAVSVSRAEGEAPIARLGFGSCVHQDRPQPIWDAILERKPDLFLMIGDNVYGDTEDMAVLEAKYAKLAAQPGFAKLRELCPVLATWDDHDYGVNDGGADYPERQESRKVFADFWKVPDSVRQREGVYDARVFGPEGKRLQVILLDTRYFRSKLVRKEPRPPKGQIWPYEPNTDPAATMLGAAQWQWLEEQLRVPADLRVIVSSIQVVSEDHPFEKWTNIPAERERLYKVLKETKATGVVFVSGDRHVADLSVMDAGLGYPVYDLTASGLNMAAKKWRLPEKNRHRVATMPYGDHFGFIGIDWEKRELSLEIRDEKGEVAFQHRVPLAALAPKAEKKE